MTSGPNELKAALKRLIDGNASDADRDAVRTALNTGVLVTGERAVAIGGNASDVIITTGDQNIVFSFKGADAATVLTALSSIAPTRLHEVPRPPADFTGREDELKELLASIEVGGITISGLQGMGGIGKTVLALKLVELLKPRYPDAEFFLDLKGASTQPLTVSEALAHVVRAYHPAAKLPESESELRGLYLSVLHGQRALLLMDNAANAEQVEPLIPPVGCVGQHESGARPSRRARSSHPNTPNRHSPFSSRSKIPTPRKCARYLPNGASKQTRETHFFTDRERIV